MLGAEEIRKEDIAMPARLIFNECRLRLSLASTELVGTSMLLQQKPFQNTTVNQDGGKQSWEKQSARVYDFSPTSSIRKRTSSAQEYFLCGVGYTAHYQLSQRTQITPHTSATARHISHLIAPIGLHSWPNPSK